MPLSERLCVGWVAALLALTPACRTAAPDPAMPARPRPAGDAAWIARARADVLAWDRDASGALSSREASALPCALLAALDDELTRDAGATLGVSFGVEPGLLWRGDRLGVEAAARVALADRLRACLGEPVVPARDATALFALATIGDPPTTPAWEAAVRGVLLELYDEDRSEDLDAVEVARLPCALWIYLEGAALAGRDRPLLVLYGISEGYLWVGDALGLHPDARTSASASAVACGLAAD